jgi:hypothetical protein
MRYQPDGASREAENRDAAQRASIAEARGARSAIIREVVREAARRWHVMIRGRRYSAAVWRTREGKDAAVLMRAAA